MKQMVKQVIKNLEVKMMSATSHVKICLLAGINRGVSPHHVTQMAESIAKKGILRPVVMAWMDFIDGTKRLYIIDGQHLYFAIMRYGVDIPYELVDIKDMQDLVETIALLNASSKTWCMNDYVTAWSAVKPSYKILQELYNTYDISLTQIVELAHKGVINPLARGGGVSRLIKKGEALVPNRTRTIQMLDKITDVLHIVPRRDKDGNYTFIGCYVEMVIGMADTYNHQRFLVYLQKNKDKFLTVTQDTEEITKLLKKGLAVK